MPYLIQGTTEQLCQGFDLNWLIDKGSIIDAIEKDLYRHRFLGSLEQAEHHINTWRNSTQEQAQYYSQGDMFAGNLFLFLNPDRPALPFIKKDEEEYTYTKNISSIGFAFVSENDELCGLTIVFRKDDPSQWMVGLVKNTNLVPSERTVVFLSSLDLKALMKSTPKGVISATVGATKNQLIDQVGSPFLKGFLQQILKPDTGKIDPICERLNLLMRFPNNEFISDPINLNEIDLKLLLAENPSLDLIVQYQLKLSSAMLKKCLSKSSRFCQEIESIELTDNFGINKHLLQMAIVFFEEQVLQDNKAFLQEHIFSKVSDDFHWNDDQIKLIPFLIKNHYDLKQIQLILSDNAFYTAVHLLIELNFTKDIPTLLNNPVKLEELNYISSLNDISSQKICLIFWVKTHLNISEYQAVVTATKDYPLIALEQAKKSSIKDLQNLSLNSKAYLQKSIATYFAEQFKTYKLKELELDKLSSVELNTLIDSFKVLIKTSFKIPEYYELALKNDNQGQLIRLFLPQLAKIKDFATRTALIEILYIGIKQNLDNQAKAIQKLSDQKFFDLAKGLHERFICVKQLQHLGIKEELLASAAKEEPKQKGGFTEYPSLDLIVGHCAPHLSTAGLKDYLIGDFVSKSSGFHKEIENIQFINNLHANKNLLEMAIVFYEEQVLPNSRDLLKEHVFSKVSKDFIWSDVQIKLIPFLIKRNYGLKQFLLILNDTTHTSAVDFLKQRGLTQNVPEFLDNPDKLEQLKYIFSLPEENKKQLCLVFWAKSNLSLEDLQAIVNATENNSLLADALLALDKVQTKTMAQLQKIALDTKKSQPLSIVHHFADEFKKYDLKKSKLKHLDSAAQMELTDSFEVLRNANISSTAHYELALENTKQGQLFRLFLPRLVEIEDLSYREELIKILYTGIKSGLVSQGKAVHEISDKKLLDLAKGVHERFICAQQLQNLDFNSEIIEFAAQERNTKATRFRQVILSVEERCEGVQERLRQSSAKKEETVKWQRADEEYRKTMYDITYEGLQTPRTDLNANRVLRNKIKDAEKAILTIVDPEITSWLRKILVIIANIVITTLTMGLANDYKLDRTGNYWFFNQTESGEKLRALDKKVIELVETSDLDTVSPMEESEPRPLGSDHEKQAL